MNVRYCPGVEYDPVEGVLRIHPRALARHLDGFAPALSDRELADLFFESLASGTPGESTEFECVTPEGGA